MSVTVRFPLLLISNPVRFALHLSLWSNLVLLACFVLLLRSACSGSWPSVQVVLVAAVLLLRSLLLLLLRLLFVAAPSAALMLLQRPWLLHWVLFLATSASASFGCLCSALLLLALLSAASTGALSCLLLRMLLRWLLLGLLLSRFT
jgi:hypothetical protein